MANSIFSYDNTLPGVITEIDSHLSAEYDTSLFGTTDSVCIIGTALDGPVNYPTRIYSVEHAAYVFGKPFDAKSKKETTLVTDIENAWRHGCRTIWALRLNGVEMQKDFELAATSEYKLRVSSRYPSNYGKQCYISYDNTDGSEAFTIYKPASRATISEKMNGLVEDENAVMVNKIRINEDYSLNKGSKLAEVLDVINNHAYNNVIELEIVDLAGNVVTNDMKTSDITLGYIFPGTYFIGRQESACDKQTKVKMNLTIEDDAILPYEGFTGKYYRSLTMNTDVSKELPIYYSEIKKMRSILAETGITMVDPDDYLEIAGESNKAFPEDKIDYTELDDLNDFKIYQRLGSGFVTTAVAERRIGKDADGNEIELVPKVHEASVSDINRVIPTGDGVYTVLEDTKIRYHVLAHNICADTVIANSCKLPKHTEFKTTVNNNVPLMNGLIEAESKVDSDDATAAHAFKIRIFNLQEKPEITADAIYTGAVAEIIGYSEDEVDITNAKPGDKYTNGTALFEANAKGVYEAVDDEKYAGLYLAGSKLFKVSYDGGIVLTEIDSSNVSAEIGEYKFFMAKQDSNVFMFTLDGKLDSEEVFAADIDTALSEEDDKLFVMYEDAGVGENNVLISYPFFETTTLGDFVTMLNESVLADKFSFSLTQAGKILRDEYMTDADVESYNNAVEESKSDSTVEVQEQALAAGTAVVMDIDRVRGYDYSKHIPYSTTDNFARHLAQHCTYTELKTYPTHGVIGCKRITDVSKTNLAKKVAELKTFNWNMFVKNAMGKNMLTNDNLPYNIGRNVSVILYQEQFATASNYNAIVNGSAAYAGFVSQLDIGQSSTGQTMDNEDYTFEPMFEFSRTQLQNLSDVGIVTAKNSFTKGFVITDGITMGAKDDLLRRLFNMRVMHFVEDYIRAACEPFIGKANSSVNRNSLNTAITSNLQSIMDTLIRSFEFKIADDNTADQLTYIDIHYVIVPMNEIREIRNYIRVQNS